MREDNNLKDSLQDLNPGCIKHGSVPSLRIAPKDTVLIRAGEERHGFFYIQFCKHKVYELL